MLLMSILNKTHIYKNSIVVFIRKYIFIGMSIGYAFSAHAAPPPYPKPHMGYEYPYEGFDLASVQRGFVVYQKVCSNCHSLKYLRFGDLQEMGLTQQQAEEIAAQFQIKIHQGNEDTTRPATLQDAMPAPYASEAEAKLVNKGELPPDMSRLAAYWPGGAQRIEALLQGYKPPPENMHFIPPHYYNIYGQNYSTDMPPPLHDKSVTFNDGTPATLAQEAHDVAVFLAWVAYPHHLQRHRWGISAVIYLVFVLILAFLLKRKIWSNVG